MGPDSGSAGGSWGERGRRVPDRLCLPHVKARLPDSQQADHPSLRSQRALRRCTDCHIDVAGPADACPTCGGALTPQGGTPGWGYEYRSPVVVLGLPLIHVSCRYRTNGVPVPARGIIAIGQFAIGFVTIGQFGIGVLSLSQLTIAVFAVAQVAVAYSLIAQVGIYVASGAGQMVKSVTELLALF